MSAIQKLERHASEHHGVFHLRDACRLGVSTSSLHRLVRRGLIQRLHPSTYVFGCAPTSDRTWWMAAVVAAGDCSALSGRAAALLWRIWRGKPPRAIDVVVTGRCRPRRGVKLRQVRQLLDDEVTVVDRIRVLRVERLLIEFAADGMSGLDLCDVIDQAAFRGVFSEARLRRFLARYPSRRGRARLVAALGRFLDGDRGSKSAFESRAIGRVVAMLNVPYECNRMRTIGGRRMKPDMFIPDLQIALEFDDMHGHSRPTRVRDDHERDLAYARGRIVRFRIRSTYEEEDLRRACTEIARRQRILTKRGPRSR